MRRKRWMWTGTGLALLIGLVALTCGRERVNPLDPQAGSYPGRPNPPTNVTATGSFGRITVTWTPPTGITDLAGYGVYRSTSPTEKFTFLKGDVKGDTLITIGGNTFVDSSFVGDATVYYYRVTTVIKARLFSDMSNPARGEVLKDTSPPAAPQNLSVQSDPITGAVTVKWTSPTTDATGKDLTGLSRFRVYRSEGTTGSFILVADTTSAVTSIVDKAVKGGTQYSYTVSALDPLGNESPRATSASLTTAGITVPTGLRVAGDVGRVTLTWNPVTDEGLKGYNVYRASLSDGNYVRLGPAGVAFTTGQTAYVDSNLVANSQWFYKVSAVTATGESVLSTFVGSQVKAIGIPSGLRATGDVSRVILNWNANTEDNLRGYNVYRASQSDGSYARLGPAGVAFTTGQTAYVDSNLVGGSTFYYKVSAVVSGGEGMPSLFVGATVLADNIPPAAPGNLSAQLDDVSLGRASLNWSAPTADANGKDLTGLSGYRIYRSKGNATSFVQVATTTKNVYVDSGLEPLTVYFYTVSAYDPTGNESARAASVSITTKGVAIPANVRATGEIGRITLTWSPNTETELLGYNVYRSARSDTLYTRLQGNEGTRYTTGQASYIDSNLVANSRFFYRVSAVGTSGEGQLSVFATATVLVDDQPPAAPSNLLAELDPNVITRVTLRWTAPNKDANGKDLTGLSGYRVFRNNVQIATSTATTYVDNSADPLTAYIYNVSAVDPTGNVSPLSNTVSVTTKGLGVPANVTATGDVNLIQVTWAANQERDLLGYRVYRSTSPTGTFSPIGGIQDTTITTAMTVYADSNLAAGTQLYYKVRAVAVSGVSDLSRFAVATALDDNRAPATPDVNFLSIRVSTDSPTILVLTWRAPTTDVGGAILTGLKGYRLYRATGSGSFAQIAEVLVPTLTYTDSDPTLQLSTTYYYKLSAFDPKGNESPLTAAVSAQTGGVPAPTNLTATASVVSATTGQVVLSWSAPALPGAADYEIQRQVVGTTSSSVFTTIGFTSSTTYTDNENGSGLTRGQIYAYRVRSRNSTRTLSSDPSNVVSVKIP